MYNNIELPKIKSPYEVQAELLEKQVDSYFRNIDNQVERKKNENPQSEVIVELILKNGLSILVESLSYDNNSRKIITKGKLLPYYEPCEFNSSIDNFEILIRALTVNDTNDIKIDELEGLEINYIQ